MARHKSQLAAAMADHACCCPDGMSRSVRLGISQTQLMAALLVMLWVLNVCDLVLTRLALSGQQATEANAAMEFLLRRGTIAAAVFKLTVISVGVVALWRLRHHRLALIATVLLTTLFVALVTYQVLWLL